MKSNFISLAIITVLTLGTMTSYGQAFKKGTKLLDAGFEIQNSFDESVVPVFVSFEAAVAQDVGVGAKIRLWSKERVNSLAVQATGNYHFGRIMKLNTDKLDLFAGLGMGVNRIWWSDYGEISSTSVIVSPSFGARYFFNDKIGITSRIGFDNYGLNLYDYDDYEDYDYYGINRRYTDVSFAVGITFKF